MFVLFNCPEGENDLCPLRPPQGHLYLLVTDQGFLQEESMVWESLHNVEGDGNFCNSDFRLSHAPERSPAAAHLPPSSQEQQRQIDQVRTPPPLGLPVTLIIVIDRLFPFRTTWSPFPCSSSRKALLDLSVTWSWPGSCSRRSTSSSSSFSSSSNRRGQHRRRSRYQLLRALKTQNLTKEFGF